MFLAKITKTHKKSALSRKIAHKKNAVLDSALQLSEKQRINDVYFFFKSSGATSLYNLSLGRIFSGTLKDTR